MSVSQIKIVIDTNILFMAWHNPLGKCGQVLEAAHQNEIEIFAPDTVKEEITNLFHSKGLTTQEIEEFLEDYPINWIGEEVYRKALDQTKVKHKADKPIEALALILNCSILSADEHFKNIKQRIEIEDLLIKLEKG